MRLAGFAGERAAPGHHLVEHAPEREEVGARVHLLAFELLGRHVGHRADRSWPGPCESLPWSAPMHAADRRARRAASFASPKSSSLRAAFVSITLAGFRSRWTMPCSCAARERRRSAHATSSACSSGSAPLRRRCASVSPLEVLHHQEVDAARLRPTSWSAQMCGWLSAEMARASLLEARPALRDRRVAAAAP